MLHGSVEAEGTVVTCPLPGAGRGQALPGAKHPFLVGLGDRVRALRAKRGFTRRALAAAPCLRPRPEGAWKHVVATVVGNFRVTELATEYDTHHLMLDFGHMPFPLLEGRSIGILCPVVDARGCPHHVRQYSIASPRSGERPDACVDRMAAATWGVAEVRGRQADAVIRRDARARGPAAARNP